MTDPPWAQAATVGPEAMPEDLLTACQEEVQDLWSDLGQARGDAANQETRWSMHCDWLTTRIVILSRLSGITDWDRIPADLVLDGTYEGVLRTAGLDPEPLPDLAQLQALRDLISARGTNRSTRT